MIAVAILEPPRRVFDLHGAVEHAREVAKLKHEALAALLGLSAPQLSHQLAEIGHFSLTRLLRLVGDPHGRRFLQVFWGDVADYIGLESQDALALQVETLREEFRRVIDRIQVRMAKAELRRRVDDQREAK